MAWLLMIYSVDSMILLMELEVTEGEFRVDCWSTLLLQVSGWDVVYVFSLKVSFCFYSCIFDDDIE